MVISGGGGGGGLMCDTQRQRVGESDTRNHRGGVMIKKDITPDFLSCSFCQC